MRAFSVSDAALTLGPALAAVKADADAAVDKRDALINNTRVADDQEARAGRLWRRAVRTLDAKKSGAEKIAAARELIANAGDDLPVYVEELRPYLESENLPTDWLLGAYAQSIPGLSEAQSDSIRKARQHAILAQNDAALRNAMSKDLTAPPTLDPANVSDQAYSEGYSG